MNGNMKNKSVAEVRVQDPLREITRKERKFLLFASIIGLTISKVGIVPETIAMFGITISDANQSSFLTIISLVISYFVVGFIIYGISDFITWRIEINKVRLDGSSPAEVVKEQSEYDSQFETYDHLYRLVYFSRPASVIRGMFEFILPIIIGIYTIYSLVSILNAESA